MFDAIKVTKNDFKNIFNNRFMRLAFSVVVLIPLLYGVLYLWAFWDPYQKMQDMPVAVVNQDSGATQNGKQYNIGNDITDTLKSNNTVKWTFTDQTEAENGLNDHKYYIELLIPQKFSQDVLSGATNNPEKAIMVFKAREANNLLSAQITDRIAYELVQTVNHKISKQYLDQIFIQTRESTNSLVQASDGAKTINSGLSEAGNGSKTLTNGLTTAQDGSSQLSSGLSTLSTNTTQLNDALSQASEGSTQLSSGLTEAVKGTSQLASGSKDVLNGLNQVSASLKASEPQFSSLNTGVEQSLGASTEAISLINQYLASHPSDADPRILGALEYITGTQNGLTQINQGLKDSNTGLNVSMTKLSQGTNQLITGQNQVNVSLNSLYQNLKIAESGSNSLSSGLIAIKNGTSELNKGTNLAYSSSRQLALGIAQLKDGSNTLSTGLAKLASGSDTLADKLSEGAQIALNATDPTKTDSKTSVMSEPIELQSNPVDKVPNYGTGFAPYFMPLALWVGALLMTFIVNPREINLKIQRKKIVLGKFMTMAIIGVFQAVVMNVILIVALGLKVRYLGLFFLFSILMSWCFVAIMQLLVSCFGDAGKFIGIVLLMLQLTSSAGTFPLETIPTFFQKINPYLPMTYAVTGLREVISGGMLNIISAQSRILALFMIIPVVMTIIFARLWEKVNTLHLTE